MWGFVKSNLSIYKCELPAGNERSWEHALRSALSSTAYALLGRWGGGRQPSSLAALLQNTECPRAPSFHASGTGVAIGSWFLVVELVPSQHLLPTGKPIGFSFSKADKRFLKQLTFLRKHLAKWTVLGFHSHLAFPHPELRADTRQGI